MSRHSFSLFWFQAKCLFLLHSATCLAGKQQISFLKQNLVWPTQPELVPTIDRARGENANHCNTDAVDFQKCYLTKISLIASFYERLALTDTIKWISKISHWNNSKIQPKNLKNGRTPNTYTWLLTFLTWHRHFNKKKWRCRADTSHVIPMWVKCQQSYITRWTALIIIN